MRVSSLPSAYRLADSALAGVAKACGTEATLGPAAFCVHGSGLGLGAECARGGNCVSADGAGCGGCVGSWGRWPELLAPEVLVLAAGADVVPSLLQSNLRQRSLVRWTRSMASDILPSDCLRLLFLGFVRPDRQRERGGLLLEEVLQICLCGGQV